MSLKKTVMQQGMKLMSDPRVMKLMQNEQFLKAMMTAMALPGRLDQLTKEQSRRLARAMALATEQEVKDLRRTVRSLEEQLAEMRTKEHGGTGPKNGNGAR
jgi:hypothetical protein